MVFQSYALYPHLSVRDNLGFDCVAAVSDPPSVNCRISCIAAPAGCLNDCNTTQNGKPG